MAIPGLGCPSAIGISKHAFSSRTALFWVITQRVVIIFNPRFGTIYRFHLQGPRNQNLGPIGCPETSVRNYHYSLRNDPEECSSHLLRDESLKSRTPSAPLPNVVHAICLRKDGVFTHNLTVVCDNCVLTAATSEMVHHTICISSFS